MTSRTDLSFVGHALTNLAGQFLSVDDHFCELVQRERRDLLARTILEITADRDRPLNAAKLRMLREQRTPFAIAKSYIRGDGRRQAVRNLVSLTSDGLTGEVISGSVFAVEDRAIEQIASLTRTARRLLSKQRELRSLGTFFSESGWSLLLAAYVLEAEGQAVLVEDLSTLVGLKREACLLQAWSLVASGLLVVDGSPVSIARSGVRLSPACAKQVESYLTGVRVDDG